jgi:hypothetical protein
MLKTLSIAMLFVLGGVGAAGAVTKTFTWTWPTVRTDSTALPLSQIGGIQLYDISVPTPGLPGNVVSCSVTIPPVTATGTCSANVISGHSFEVQVGDTATPAGVSGPSNTVTVPLSVPAAIVDLKVQ